MSFPQTSYSAIQAVKSADPELRERALESLASVYWRPIYHHARLKWGKQEDEARDLTQQFFLFALEKKIFAAYDPRQAKFRTFLRKCLDNFVVNEAKSAARIKRGGNLDLIPLEIRDEEGTARAMDIADETNLAEEFDRHWTRGLFAGALADLKSECMEQGKQTQFAIFEAYDVLRDEANKVTYDALAATHHIPVTQVTNYLHAMRRRFRELVLIKLREVTGSDEEYHEEVRLLIGIRRVSPPYTTGSKTSPTRFSGGAGGVF